MASPYQMRGQRRLGAMNTEQIPANEKLMRTVIDLIAVTVGNKRTKINPDTPLFSSQAAFDSVGLLEFVLRLEDAFGLSIPDADLDPDVFHSPETIVAYLHTRLREDA